MKMNRSWETFLVKQNCNNNFFCLFSFCSLVRNSRCVLVAFTKMQEYPTNETAS